MDRAMIAVLMISLESLTNEEMAALNNSVQMQGKVPPQNLAFFKCKKLQLIRDSGELWEKEDMQIACTQEIKRRVEAGTFS